MNLTAPELEAIARDLGTEIGIPLLRAASPPRTVVPWRVQYGKVRGEYLRAATAAGPAQVRSLIREEIKNAMAICWRHGRSLGVGTIRSVEVSPLFDPRELRDLPEDYEDGDLYFDVIMRF